MGNFNQPASSPVAAGPFAGSVAAADLDGDDDQDLAVGNSGSVNVDDPQEQRRRQLQRAGLEPGGRRQAPIAVATADFDADGDQDLAVANNGSDDVTILRNPGGGNFRQVATSPEAVGDNPRSIAAADLDGDSDPGPRDRERRDRQHDDPSQRRLTGTDQVTILRDR